MRVYRDIIMLEIGNYAQKLLLTDGKRDAFTEMALTE
jgi:hypothetical protein